MEAKPLVSIIINNYNYEHFLPQAIESALNQTYVSTEVIVVDDGSTDNSWNVISRYGEQIIPVLKDNGGQASALNAGFAASKGEIICLLDADDLFLPEKVTEVVNIFKLYPSIEWVFHESAPVKSNNISNDKIQAPFDEVCNSKLEKKIKEIDFRANILNAELPDFTPSTSNLCFSKRISDKMFPLPEVKGFSGIAICDLYLKYLAVGLGTGCVTSKNLGIFRVHHNNLYSTQEITKKRRIDAEILMTTAYWLQIRFPKFLKLNKKIFAKGLATHLKTKSKDLDHKTLIKEYLSTTSYLERLEIVLKVFYYSMKLKFVDLI